MTRDREREKREKVREKIYIYERTSFDSIHLKWQKEIKTETSVQWTHRTE